MAASKQTVGAIYMVMSKHVPDLSQRTELIHDLLQLKGNASFRKTVELLRELNAAVLELEALASDRVVYDRGKGVLTFVG